MKIFEKFKKFYDRPLDRILVISLPVLIFLLGLQNIVSEPTPVSGTQVVDPDTLIPKGFVLLPLQLENHPSMDSIVGAHAIVNIYLVKEGTPEKSTLVGRNLRMVRAPMNPQQFAVLVPEDRVEPFVTGQGKLHAVLQNRSLHSGTEMTTRRKTQVIQFY